MKDRRVFRVRSGVVIAVAALALGVAPNLEAQQSRQAPPCTRNCSHVLVALLQSESTGEEPSFEIGTVDLLYRMGSPLGFRVISMASLDVAVSDKKSDDDTSEPEPESGKLTDAGMTVAVPKRVEGGQREWFAGVSGRIFQTDPMWGFAIGSVETNDTLYGTRFSLGWTWPLLREADATENLANQNLFAEFLFRFPMQEGDDEQENVIGLLRHLNFRGSILIPNDDTKDVLAKIAVIVPIKAPFKF